MRIDEIEQSDLHSNKLRLKQMHRDGIYIEPSNLHSNKLRLKQIRHKLHAF